jgi:hypothetical protein
LTVIGVYGNYRGIQGMDRINLLLASLVEERSPADVICYFSSVFDELHSPFKFS